MVVKKTPRTTKSVPSPEVPADSPASAPSPRRRRAAAPKTTPSEVAAKPKAPRATRAARPAAPLKTPAPVPVESPVAAGARDLNGQSFALADETPATRGTYRPVTEDDIRLRAYFLSLEHRGQGSPEYFWTLAERELRQRASSR